MDLKRHENETEFDYHKRLIQGKLIDKTLADADYSELSECVYGKAYSSDVARRMMYGSQRTIELIENSMVDIAKSGNELCDDIDEKILQLSRERQRVKDQRREYNKQLAIEGRFENLMNSLQESAATLNETIGDLFSTQNKANEYSEDEAIVVFSDWHYGLTVNNIYNKFNTDICKERVKKVTWAAISRIAAHHCRVAHIVVLGDLWHGAIHTSARVASEELVCDQLMKSSEILAQAILNISQYVDQTYVYMTYGNHARTVQNKNDSLHHDNMERIVPWWLEQRFKDHGDIDIVRNDEHEFITVNACGHNIVAVHGDLDNVRSSSTVLSTIFHKVYGIDVDYIILGDKHHSESFDNLGVTSVICGALCGSDDYANDRRLYSTPEQLMLTVNKDCGVDAQYRLKC